MYIVNAVDSFCNLKLSCTKGNGEKKLYLTTTDSLTFVKQFFGIDVKNGANIYAYNDEIRSRILGYTGFITKSNLQDVFNKTIDEYSKTTKYRTNLAEQKAFNEEFLKNMGEVAEFKINCSISQDRIYIGSPDKNWFAIPAFCIPKETRIRITKSNDPQKIQFELL